MSAKGLSKSHKVGLLLGALTVVLYVVISTRQGFSIIHGVSNLATYFKGKDRQCNESFHSELPNDTIIEQMDTDNLYDTFFRYATRPQINCCNVSRAGSSNTFGKNICLDNFQNVRNNCLVYSFGSQFHFEFENSIWKKYKCEIHTFDPSLSTNGVHIPEGVNFHLTGLSDIDTTIQVPKSVKDISNWTMKTLSTIRKSLNHGKRNIDILKIDIEGWEWNVIPEVIQSRDLKYVKQLCLEVHFGFKFEDVWSGKRLKSFKYIDSTWGNVTIQNQLKALKHLYEQGFRIFKSEPIPGWGMYYLKKYKKSINTLIEISLVSTHN